jgi:branched-chain amino acid transport system permease protein
VTGSYLVGLVLAVAIVAPAGIICERYLIRRVQSEPELTIILTIGIMLVLEEGALAIFGGDVRTIGTPLNLSVPLFGINYPGFRIVVAAVAAGALLALWAFIRFTRFGLWMRAVKHSPSTASAFGVPVNRVFAVTFGIGTGLAALGGALAAPIVNVRPEMGLDILVTVFIVVILGGLGSLGGSVVIAVLMTTSEGLASVFMSPANARVLSLAVLAVVVILWPNGLAFRRNSRVKET